MTGKGKHAEDGSGSFYRDLALMVAGIILVGAAVFFLLFLLADNPDSGTTTIAEPGTTTTIAATTTSTEEERPTTTTSSTSTTTTVPVRPPEEVRVVVLNSIGLAGAAGRMTERLEQAGYQTLQADDFEPEQNPSVIWYREDFSAEANQLLEFIPGANVEAIPDEDIGTGADVVMILGIGYEE